MVGNTKLPRKQTLKEKKGEINSLVFSFPNPPNVSLFNQSLPRLFLREKQNLEQGKNGGGSCEIQKGGKKERKEEKWKGGKLREMEKKGLREWKWRKER